MKRKHPTVDSFEVQRLEAMGRTLDPTLGEDSASSMAAFTLGVAEMLRVAGEFKAANPTLLSVPDAGSLTEFLKNARKVYRKAHLPSKRGPKFSEGRVLSWISDLEIELKRPPTRKEIIERLTDDNNHYPKTVSRRTAGKCAKLYLLLSPGKKKFSKRDARWLRTNFGPQNLSPHWLEEKRWQWFGDRLDETGVSAEIRGYFKLSGADLEKKCKELEALWRQRVQEWKNLPSPS